MVDNLRAGSRALRGALLLPALLALLLACGGEPETKTSIDARHDGAAVPWTGLDAGTSPSEFRFAVVSDNTGEARDGVFRGAMPKLNLVEPDFVLSVGDLIEGYSEDLEVLGEEWGEIEDAVGMLRMPFFYAAGNHDMSNAAMAEEWQRRFGPSFYHFRYKDVLFLVLNSELFGMVHDPKKPLPGPWTQAEQLAYVERVLAENAAPRWTFVIVHQPLWDRGGDPHPDWLAIEALLGERDFTVFAGHYHRYTEHVRQGRKYITLATTGGGSRLRGLPFGEFDHVAHVTMTDQGPVIANLLLDGIQGTGVRSEDMRATVAKLERAIEALPILGTGGKFRDGLARYSIANQGDAPLEIIGRFETGRDIEPFQQRVERTIAAGDAIEVAVPVRAKSSVAYEEVAPTRVQWTLRTRQGEIPVEIAQESVLLPERIFEIGPVAAPVKVDGVLAEWNELPFVVEIPGDLEGHGVHKGSADASFRFGIGYDQAHVFLAVDARDDSLVSGGDRSVFRQDHLAISVDPRPDPKRSQNGSRFAALRNGEFGKMVSALLALTEPRPDQIVDLFVGEPPAGLQRAARPTSGGYAAEFAIPSGVLDEHRGSSWDVLRVNVSMTDFDEDEPDHTVIHWRPDRFGARAAEGMGSFVRKQVEAR